jgi:hypothetical protein
MKFIVKILIFLIGFFHLNLSFGQEVENDTIFVKRVVQTESPEIDTILFKDGISLAQPQILIGTTFLPNTNKMIGLLNKGLTPISLEIIEECDKSIHPKSFIDYPKFTTVKRDCNTLTIDVTVIANCCHNFLGEAEIIGDDTLNLIYTSYGGFCSCQCCFTLSYKFNTTMEEYYQILKKVTINNSGIINEIPN